MDKAFPLSTRLVLQTTKDAHNSYTQKKLCTTLKPGTYPSKISGTQKSIPHEHVVADLQVLAQP